MKKFFFTRLVCLLIGGLVQADDKTTQSRPIASAPQQIIFKKLNFDNNTLGEMVIKLNAMTREELKDQNTPTVVINLKGLSENGNNQNIGKKSYTLGCSGKHSI